MKQNISILIRKLITCIAMLALCTGSVFSQTLDLAIHQKDSRLVRQFNDNHWKMTMMLPGQGIKEELHKMTPEDIETNPWYWASIPGDVYTDLWKNGAIEDPYFGRNTAKATWVGLYEWWYARKFSVSESVKNKIGKLEFESVDYACDVYLNGVHLGRHEGAFSSFSFDVTKVLRTSNNQLDGMNMLMLKLDPPPKVNGKVAGLKTPWFGDYWRHLIPIGITGKVKMVSSGKVRIDDVYAKTTINDNGSADVLMEVQVENTTGETKKMHLTASIAGKNFNSKPISVEIEQTVAPGKHLVSKNIHVKKPNLWYPWDLGKPNLYLGKVSIKEENVNHDYREITFGIREVKMKWNPGWKKGVDLSFPRTTMINGKFHFIRSACWGGPPDIFVGRTSIDEYRKIIEMAKDANMNNIRIFGWHPPEIPEFYEICNEMGMTVWQDMLPFGTGNTPQTREYMDKVMAEAKSVVINRRNNPCIILMEGGEEFLFRIRDPHFGLAFMEELGDTLQAYLDLPYVPDSPLKLHKAQEVGFKPKEATHVGKAFYAPGQQLFDEYLQEQDYPIVPEFMYTSVPSVESLKKFIPENELWPPGLSWGHHWADLDRLRSMNWEVFGDEKTASLEEFVNATQDAQGTFFQYGIEHFRRQKPRLSGISLCHLITYWPDMKWGLIDNYQKPKRSLEFVKTAYQPLLVNLFYKKRRWHNDEPFKAELWVVNDLYQDYENCKVEFELKDNTGKSLYTESFKIDNIEENSSKKFFEISAKVLAKVNGHFTTHLTMTDVKGKVLSSNEYMLLIGDQKQAAIDYKKYSKEISTRQREYPYGNYFGFFPEITGEGGKKYESDKETPRAKGFE